MNLDCVETRHTLSLQWRGIVLLYLSSI